MIHKLLGEPIYTFRLEVEGVVPEVSGDGRVLFRDASSGRPVFYLPPPFMTDAAGAVSTEIAVRLAPAGPIDPSLALWPGQLGLEPYWSYYDLGLDDRGGIRVNLYNGNLVVSYLDTYHTAQGPATFLERTYNSRDDANGILGYNWVHNYFGFALENPDGTVVSTDADGTRTVFTPHGDGTYSPPPGVHKKLTRTEDASGLLTFTLETVPAHLVETFDASGNLISRADNNGNTTTFAYAGGALSTVTDASGGVTAFTCSSPDGGILTVTDPAGRTPPRPG